MEITFTSHAEYRLKKRGLLREEVVETIKHPDKIDKKHGKQYFQKNIGRGTIEVCCEKTEKHINVITVYWI